MRFFFQLCPVSYYKMHLTCNDLSKEVGMIFQSAAVAVSRYSCPVIALPKLFYRKQYPKTFHIKKKSSIFQVSWDTRATNWAWQFFWNKYWVIRPPVQQQCAVLKMRVFLFYSSICCLSLICTFTSGILKNRSKGPIF